MFMPLSIAASIGLRQPTANDAGRRRSHFPHWVMVGLELIAVGPAFTLVTAMIKKK
jgi:hypothetical protein